METKYFVTLEQIEEKFHLEKVFLPENGNEIHVNTTEVSRPGLQLTGFYGHFEPERIQIIGNAEHEYLTNLTETERLEALRAFFGKSPVCVIVSSNLSVFPEMKKAAEEFKTPLFLTKTATSPLMAAIISYLSVELAPRITRHGVFVEVYGEGILLLGDSGVGKSETAIELVKRGHRLIADDAVEIKRVSATTLIGNAPELIRHYIELRGIGIIDVRRIFGMGAVKNTEKIDLIIKLEHWVEGKVYDRLGMDTEYTDIMGIQIPSITIPVRPGRNLAIILEIAAMNNRQKKMGYNTAVEFNKKLMGMYTDNDR